MASNESSAELNLKSFIYTINSRKKSVISIILTLTILSVIVSYSIPKTYRATATFEMGYFFTGTQNYISDSKTMREKLRSILVVEGGFGPIKDIQLPVNKAPAILYVISESDSTEVAVSAIEDAFDLFSQMNYDFINAIAQSNTVEEQIRTIVLDQFNRKEKLIVDKIDKILIKIGTELTGEESIKDILYEQSNLNEVVTRIELDNLIKDAILLLSKQLGMKVSSNKSVNSPDQESDDSGFIPPRIVGNINLLPYPVSPNKRAIVSLTFIVSIFLSLMYVFLSEYLRKILKEENI